MQLPPGRPACKPHLPLPLTPLYPTPPRPRLGQELINAGFRISGPLLASQLLWMSLEDLEGVRSLKKELGKVSGGGKGTLKVSEGGEGTLKVP